MKSLQLKRNVFKTIPVILTLVFCVLIFDSSQAQTATNEKGLKDYFRDYFTMGVAVSPQALKREDESKLILQQFNSVTPENAMKMGPIHPQPDKYNWAGGDSIVAYAQRNGLKVRGHALCWHQQTPSWFFTDSTGKQVTKEVLLQRLKEHITTVVQRYKGKIYAWDVVNEAIDDNPDNYLRNSLFYQICGEDFIPLAFQYAHEADPNAILFYNDYNTERKEKTDRVYKLVKSLKDKGVPIHGIGLQGHWSIFEPSQSELEYALEKFSSLKLNIQITELDVSIYKWEKNQRPKEATDIDTFTPELERQQMDKYRMAFELFKKYKKHITGITFWNISDRSTWLDQYPVRGRKNYPLLFDTNLKPKKVYWEIVGLTNN